MNDDDWDAFKSQVDFSRLGLTQPADWYTTRTAGDWHQALSIDSYDAVLCVASVLRLITPQWENNRSSDSVPIRAIDAALNYLEHPDSDLEKHVAVLAKGCTASRAKSLGYEHRIAEAARAFSRAVIAKDDRRQLERLSEALAKIEEHLLYRRAVKADHGKERETRRQMLVTFVDQLRTLAT